MILGVRTATTAFKMRRGFFSAGCAGRAAGIAGCPAAAEERDGPAASAPARAYWRGEGAVPPLDRRRRAPPRRPPHVRAALGCVQKPPRNRLLEARISAAL